MKIIKNENAKKPRKLKLPRFMIAENPMAQPGEEYILHTKSPKMLLKVIDATGVAYAKRNELVKKIAVGASCEVNGQLFYIYPIAQYSHISQKNLPEINEDLSLLMKRIADWWKSYIIFEEKNYEN